MLVKLVENRARIRLTGEFKAVAGAEQLNQALEPLRAQVLSNPRILGDLLSRPRAQFGTEPRRQRPAKLFAEGEQPRLG